jgi:Na+-translocating ferredoxin:NAD+ oxidoreductase RnfG subunit
MTSVAKPVSLFPWGRVAEALAWASLLVAFVLGQVAAQTDYEALLKKQMPGVGLSRSDANKELPIVYRMEVDGELLPDVVVMSEGVGYGGPLVVGIKARRTDEGARISEILMLSHKETPSFMERLRNKDFFRQFAGKDITDNFMVDDDIDGVSGATVSSVAFASSVREAVHLGAVQHFKLAPTWNESDWNLGVNELILVSLFASAFFGVYKRNKAAKYARYIVMGGTLAFIGFYANASISLGNIAGIFMGYIPSPKQHPMWWIMMGGALGSAVILGRNIYCHQLCPFKIVQDLMQKLTGVKLRIKPEVQRMSRALIFFLSWAALMLIFISRHPALGSYEPFAMMFSLEGLGIQWYILPASLLGAMFVPSFWCRLFCPVGLYLNEIVRFRRTVRNKFFPGKSVAPVVASSASVQVIEISGEKRGGHGDDQKK